ncbi:MAG: substrate-binding domain-containing protein [Dehalococcoidia bacterium]|nr:MAG: substrate-binding domain-containing protein [Dehalococcoidia bacterium]
MRRPMCMALLGALAILMAVGCGGGGEEVILATTTSTYDSGLLDALVPDFEGQTDYEVKIIAVGTGQALAMGERGDADVLLVHAPSSELELVESGAAINRQLVMHNDFIIVGPEDDPAGIEGMTSAADAFATIHESEAVFISRGDDSGTHKKEKAIWESAGLDPEGQSWYKQSGQGMGATLQIANQKDSYTLSDRGTYLALNENIELVVLVEGDPVFFNMYHVMQVNPQEFDKVNGPGGAAFVDFIVSDSAQDIIRGFGVDEFGQPLFIPDAGKDESELAPS